MGADEDKRLREKNFAKLNDKEQAGVLREADKVAGLFSRIYAKFLSLVSSNRAERYQGFLDCNPHMGELSRNTYVPRTESAAAPFQHQDDRHVNISLFPGTEEAVPNGPARVVPIDALLEELEGELNSMELEPNSMNA